MVVGISENGSDWTSESVEMGPSRGKATMGLDHGVTAILHWNPNTGSVPGAGGHPLAEPRSNQVFLIVAGIVVLLLLIGGIGVIVRLARSSQSSGGKAVGIGCTVLLLGGLLLGLVPATVYLSFRAKAVESARDWRQAQKEEMAKIEAEVEGRSEGRPLERPQFVPAAEGPTIQIGVHGSVARPGTYTLRADATLLDALAAAGGWTDKAKLDEIFINFGGKGSAYDLRKILDGRDPNPALATGHNVFVARRKP
jgi:hypothetical protein